LPSNAFDGRADQNKHDANFEDLLEIGIVSKPVSMIHNIQLSMLIEPL